MLHPWLLALQVAGRGAFGFRDLLSSDATLMLAALGLAGFTTAASYWLTGWLARSRRLGTLDRPGERSLHSVPTPRTGGLAILTTLTGAIVAGLALALWIGLATHGRDVLVILLATVVLVGYSYWGDLYEQPVVLRLAIQGVAGATAVWSADLAIEAIPVPALGALALGSAAVPLTVVALVWMTNLYNFMDGMDGLAGGMTVAGFAALAWFAWRSGHYVLGGPALFAVAATSGFLVHNFPPARIFMGDVGSVPLGFLAGSLALLGVRDRLFDVWVPLLIFSPFAVDATATLMRRLLRGEPVWRAHREHYYQRLVLAGWGHRKTVLAEYALMLVCGATAVAYARLAEPDQLFLLSVAASAYCLLLYGVRVVETTHSGCA